MSSRLRVEVGRVVGLGWVGEYVEGWVYFSMEVAGNSTWIRLGVGGEFGPGGSRCVEMV